jgi:hypothetical protein
VRRGPSIATVRPLISGESHLAGISLISPGLDKARSISKNTFVSAIYLLRLLDEREKAFNTHRAIFLLLEAWHGLQNVAALQDLRRIAVWMVGPVCRVCRFFQRRRCNDIANEITTAFQTSNVKFRQVSTSIALGHTRGFSPWTAGLEQLLETPWKLSWVTI